MGAMIIIRDMTKSRGIGMHLPDYVSAMEVKMRDPHNVLL